MARTYYTLLLLCFMTKSHAAEDPQYYCPGDGAWHLTQGACFMVTDPMSWYEARDYCQAQKGNLAFFDTRSQYDMATSMMSEEPTWIGLYSSNIRVDRTYSWINNKNGKLTFTAWGENEPSLGSDSCVSIVKGVSAAEGGWQDDPCYMKLPFICQKKKEDTECGRQGWFEDTQTGLCYFHSGLLLHSWFQSNAYCLKQGAQLVSPDTERANTFLQSSVMPEAGSAWIGMWDPYMNDTWTWSNPIGQVNWTNWMMGQPDNGGHLSLHCATLGCGVPGGWVRDHCTAHYPFVCEIVSKEDSANCPEGWEEGTWNNSGAPKHCLKVMQTRSTWQKARQACRGVGADLVTLDTQDKSTWIKETFLSNTQECVGTRWWIGLNSLQEGLRWTWLETTAEVNYADWQTDPASHHRGSRRHGGEDHDYDIVYDYYDAIDGATNGHDRKAQGIMYPDVGHGDAVADYWDHTDPEWNEKDYNNYKDAEEFQDIAKRLQQRGLFGEHYDDKAVLMLTVESVHKDCVGCWVNVPHTAAFPALCEIDHGGCVEAGHTLQYGGHCYKLLPPGQWAAQQDHCKYMDGMGGGHFYLAVIDNQLELDYLTGALKGVEEASPGVYIGLNAFEKPYHFKWLIDDPIYANVTPSTFTHWLPGEPHRHPRHGCVVAGPNQVDASSMVWSDGNCLGQAPALCRRKPLNASVYYDFKLKNSIYKVTHQKVGATTDFKLLCSELLGQEAHLVQVDSIMEYHLLTNLLHYEFSGAVDLWVGNFSRILVWGTHHIAPPKVDGACPPVLSITSGVPHIGKRDCCLSRYALCERTIMGTTQALYDVRVGSKLYRFVNEPANISYDDAQKKCGDMPQGFHGRLLSITTPEEYMMLSAEMRVLQSPGDSQYWISKSTSWMDYIGTKEFVVRNVDRLAHGVPCLVASLGQDTSEGSPRRLTKHDYLHIQPAPCNKLMGGYICQSQLSLTQIRTEHTVLRRIFEDMLTKYFRFNATAFRAALKKKPALAVVTVAPEPPPACGPACVGLAVTLPIMCIVFFVIGFLVARFCRKGGYHLMISQSRRHRMDDMDIPFTTST